MFMECFLLHMEAPRPVASSPGQAHLCLRKGESVEDSVAVLGGYTDLVVLRHPGKVANVVSS